MMVLRFTLTLLLLSALVLATASCDDQSTTAPVSDSALANTPVGNVLKSTFAPSQEMLEFLFYQDTEQVLPEYEYELALSGLVSVADGGLIWGRPASWPLESTFLYRIEAGSITPRPEYGEMITVSVSVPVRSTVFGGDFPNVMPMILKPDGLLFGGPNSEENSAQWAAELTFSFHPNLEPSCEGLGYSVFSIDETGDGGGDGAYTYNEFYTVGTTTQSSNLLKLNTPVKPPPPEIAEPLCGTGIVTKIFHHSRWGAVKNDGGTGGTGGGIDPFGPPPVEY